MSVSRKTMEHPVLILIFFFILGALGLFTLSKVSIALFPEIENPVLSISTSYPNAGPESVEKTVTKPIESAVMSVNGLKKLSSTSNEGSSNVQLEFEYGTNLDNAINDIRDKLDRVKRALPENASTPMIFRFSGDSSSIMNILVQGNRSVDDLKAISENTIKNIIEQADGVGEAQVYGGRTAQVNVLLDQNRMAAYGFTVPTISAALAKQNLELGGGKLQEGHKNYIVRTTGEYSSIDEINDTVIATVNGYAIKLRDVGEASLGYGEATSESFINGQKGVYVSVNKQSDANTVKVADNVYKKIEQAKNSLPPDITMEIVSDSTTIIRETISTLIDSAWQGLILAVLILFIFLQNFKSTIIISISIPLSIIITLFAMSMFGITLNMMTLTGLILGVGMIVDASIVIIDNIYTYRQRGARPKVAAILGTQEMFMSVISGNLTTICVFIPFIFFIAELEIMGQLFEGIIFTIVIALVSSLFVAIFLVPVLAGKFLPLSNRDEKPVKNRVLIKIYGSFQKVIEIITRKYTNLLKKSLSVRGPVIFLSVAILIFSIALVPTMQIVMMPGGNEDSVRLNISLATGTPLDETRAVVMKLSDYVDEEIKGAKSVTVSIGGRNGRTNSGSIEIALPETKEQIDSAEVMKSKLRAHFIEFPGVRLNFRENFTGQMFGSDIDIILRSDDLDASLTVADQIADILDKNPETSEANISMDKGLPQVEIVIDRQRAYDFGVDVTTVAREINYAINGTTACTYRKDGTDYSVIVSYRPEDRKTIEDLETIYVRGTSGMVSVANFASVKKGLGPVSIARESQSRIIHVRSSILSKTDGKVLCDQIKNTVDRELIVPDQVVISYEGAWKNTNTYRDLFVKIAIMAIILVFGVMAATYESFKAPFINLFTIPFLIIGVVFSHKIIGEPISLMSLVGCIMLIGIVVNNGIILVDYTNLLVGRGMSVMEACVEAGRSRFRPVLMTTLTTILGMLPMCFAKEGQSLLVRPIAIAVSGGLISSTLVTLILIPILYSLIMKSKDKKKSKILVEY